MKKLGVIAPEIVISASPQSTKKDAVKSFIKEDKNFLSAKGPYKTKGDSVDPFRGVFMIYLVIKCENRWR